jgi:outer membrane protein W
MGIRPDRDYAKVDLTTTPEGSVIMATVEDPSKIGGCLTGDRVELTNLGNGEWKITRLANGSGFQFTTHKEDGVTKITKTETFGQTTTKPAGQSRGYITFKAGIYSPESDDLELFDTNFAGEVSFGHYINPKLSVDFGIGYLYTDASISGYLWGAGAEIRTIPVTVTLKGIVPFEQGELYGGGGVGVYFVQGEATIVNPYGKFPLDDDDVTFGINFNLGLNINVSENAFIGVEGKYFLAEATFYDSLDVKLDGFIATFNIGFRF